MSYPTNPGLAFDLEKEVYALEEKAEELAQQSRYLYIQAQILRQEAQEAAVPVRTLSRLYPHERALEPQSPGGAR